MKFIPWALFFKRRNQIVDEKAAAVIAIEAPCSKENNSAVKIISK